MGDTSVFAPIAEAARARGSATSARNGLQKRTFGVPGQTTPWRAVHVAETQTDTEALLC